MLNPDQLRRYQSWFDNHHHQLRDLVTELEATSIKAITETEGWGLDMLQKCGKRALRV